MNREQCVKLAQELGWKPWGKLRPRIPGNGSKYQCFRRKNHYAWIGLRFVEVDTCDFAENFVDDPMGAQLLLTYGQIGTENLLDK
jgi:hypothetical protein